MRESESEVVAACTSGEGGEGEKTLDVGWLKEEGRGRGHECDTQCVEMIREERKG